MSTDLTVFTHTIDGRRLALGLGVKETADLLGVPLPTLNRWRSGIVENARERVEHSHDVLCRLEDLLERLVDDYASSGAIPLENPAPGEVPDSIHKIAVARAAARLRSGGHAPNYL